MEKNHVYETPKSELSRKDESDPWRDNDLTEELSNSDSFRRSFLRTVFDFSVGLIAVVIGLALIFSQILSIGENISGLARSIPSGTPYEVGFASGGLVWMVPIIMMGWYLTERGFNTVSGKGWYKVYKTGPSYFFDIRYPIYGTLISMTVVTIVIVIAKFA